jgi:hypothetical protein
MRRILGCLMLVFGSVSISLVAMAADGDLDQLLKTVQSIGKEGQGNRQALTAVSALSQQPASAILPILSAIDSDRKIVANYLRTAVEQIVARELAAGRELPIAALEKFLSETGRDPRARRFAFELIVSAKPDRRAPLIASLLNDPSVELRREAVQRLIDRAAEELKAEKKDAAKATFQEALAAARAKDQVEAIRKPLEELGEKVDLPKHFGFVTSWRLIGPFDNKEKKGFPVVYAPEKGLDFAAELEGKDGVKLKWSDHTTTDDYGVVDLNKVQTNHKGAITYAAAEYIAGSEREVDLRLGTPNAWKLWLNGEELFAREEYHRAMELDQYKVRGRVKAGKNVILLKVCQNEQTEEWAQRWQFQLRVCDRAGTAIPPAAAVASK